MRYLLDQPWRLGLFLGLTTGLLTALALHYGWHRELSIEKPVRWLASCPPLTWGWVMELGREIQLVILVCWWAAAGAALGWLFDGNKSDKAAGVLLAITLFTAHHNAYNNIGLALEWQGNELKNRIDKLF